MVKHKVDVDFIEITRRTGIGKTTLAVSLAIQYSLTHSKCVILSNIILTIPGIETLTMSKISELLNWLAVNQKPCVIILDQFDMSYSSAVGWLDKTKDQRITEIVANARKYNAVALIATSQGKKKIKNSYRLNCKYVFEPTGTLDAVGCPEFLVWNDIELYEESRARYTNCELGHSIIPLDALESFFNTREIVPFDLD